MRKQVFGRRFKRDRNERKALFSGLISAMVLKGRISTTEEKAKAVRGDLEKLVTKAKKESPLLGKYLKPFEVDKLINEIAPTFKDRNGGYTRIIKTGKRLSDNASMAILEWSEKIIKNEEIKNKSERKKSSEKPTKKTARASLRKTKTARKTVRKTSSKERK